MKLVSHNLDYHDNVGGNSQAKLLHAENPRMNIFIASAAQLLRFEN